MALVKYNDRSLRNLTTTPAAVTGNSPGALVHIKTLTASSSATLSFVDGASSVVLDNTYPIYKFEFINIHPSADKPEFQIQFNAAGGSGFNETITSTSFLALHYEDASAAQVAYETAHDLAQATSGQNLVANLSNDNDSSVTGELTLFNPSSTTFVKHFMGKTNGMEHDSGQSKKISVSYQMAGYINTTSAIDEVQFKFNSGNIDSGTIKLYGIKDA